MYTGIIIRAYYRGTSSKGIKLHWPLIISTLNWQITRWFSWPRASTNHSRHSAVAIHLLIWHALPGSWWILIKWTTCLPSTPRHVGPLYKQACHFTSCIKCWERTGLHSVIWAPSRISPLQASWLLLRMALVLNTAVYLPWFVILDGKETIEFLIGLMFYRSSI